MTHASPAFHPCATTPDPHLPGLGGTPLVLEHLELELDVRLAANRLSGKAVLTGTVTEQAEVLELDLHRLKASAVTVGLDGGRAAPVRFAQPRLGPGRLRITLPRTVPAGTAVRIGVEYAGVPKPRRSPWGTIGWEELTDGVLVAGQPHGASTWFPVVDSPAQRLTAQVTVTCDAGYLPLSNGRGRKVRAKGSRVSWSWTLDTPVAPYLLTVQIGRYRLVELPDPEPAPHDAASPSLLLAVAPEHERRAVAALSGQHRMMRVFSSRYGPYPFEDYTAVIASEELEIPLECAGLSLFGTNHLTTGWEAERLIAHELSHQWFGNALTVGRWSEVWLHEGFACFSEWVWSEDSGRATLAEHAGRAWDVLAAAPQDLVTADPDQAEVFDDRIYKRGALTLYALLRRLGADVFWAMLRAWVDERRLSTVDTAAFVEHVHRWCARADVTVEDVDALMTAWLHRAELPPLPA